MNFGLTLSVYGLLLGDVLVAEAGVEARDFHAEDVGDDRVNADSPHHPGEEHLLEVIRLAALCVHEAQQHLAQPRLASALVSDLVMFSK